MKPKLTRKDLIKRLDVLRQTYARYEGAKKRKGVWINQCVTCGQTVRCDKANGGHFILGPVCLYVGTKRMSTASVSVVICIATEHT